jgi:hypothetical protein
VILFLIGLLFGLVLGVGAVFAWAWFWPEDDDGGLLY